MLSTQSSIRSINILRNLDKKSSIRSYSLNSFENLRNTVLIKSGKMESNQNGSNASHASSSNASKYPVSGIVAIVKPSGPTSMSILDKLKPLLKESKVFQQINDLENPQPVQKRDRYKRGGHHRRNKITEAISPPKLGQGGTLDPLADGVLVIGIGAGTKKLQDYIQCTKKYRTTALLGSSTLSYDCKDPILERKPFEHVQPERMKEFLKSDFLGDHMQSPPLYSAVRIGGKRLFDYARSGTSLPTPIQPRKVTISKIDLVEWLKPDQHTYKEPEQECSEEEKKLAIAAQKLVDGEDGKEKGNIDSISSSSESNPAPFDPTSEGDGQSAPPAFTLEMTVSSGTYVRSIVHDLAAKLDSAAHVVRLTRVRQGDWVLPGYTYESDEKQPLKEAIEWKVIEDAINESLEKSTATKKRKLIDGESQEMQYGTAEGDETKVEENDFELKEWEKLILERMERC